MLSTGHARALPTTDDKEQQYSLANKIFEEKMSVREVEHMMQALQKPKTEKKRKEEVPNKFIYEDVEEKLKNILGTKVSVNHKKNNKGKIEIEYYSNEELERLLELFETIHEQGA